MGQLSANGQVFILNEQGVVFGTGAQVNVGGLVAGTMDIANQDFLNGNLDFSANSSAGSVLNEGVINAADGGYVVLLGGDVQNTGIVTATMGSVALLSGEEVSLNFDGTGLLSYSVDGGVVGSLVENKGLIQADGGLVVMSGQTAGDLMATVVNNEGVVQAGGLIERDGKVVLASNATILNSGSISVASSAVNGGSVSLTGARVGQLGDINADGETGGGNVSLRADETIAFGADSRTTANAGNEGDGGEVIAFTEGEALFRRGAEIDAVGGANDGDGGFVEVSGIDYVEINGSVDTSAANGASGTFLIDPTDITIGGATPTGGIATVGGTFQSDGSTGTSFILDDDLLALLDTTNVIVTTQTGAESLTAPSGADIIVGFDAVLDASILGNAANNSLTLQAGEDIQVIGSINMDGGDLILEAGVRTDIDTGSIITVGLVTAEKITASADSLITLTNISANSVDLTINQTGPISATNDKTLAATANTASGTGDITITTTAGDINVEAIDAGARTVTLNAAGAIDAAADNASAEVMAGTLGLTAATGIGAGANSFDIENVNSASASTGDGNIAIDVIGGTGTISFSSIDNQGTSTDTVTIDQQGTQALSITTVSTANGDINLTSADSNISVSTASAGNNQNVNVVTTGSAADVSVGSVTGNVVTITATGAIQELGADGTVDISATQAALTGATGIGASDAIETDIDMLAATASGDIMLSNSGALAIGDVGAVSGVSTTVAGNITISNDSGITLTSDVNSVGTVMLDANTAGNIVVGAEDAGADITGTTVTLSSIAGSIGEAAAGGAIDITASVAVNADVTGSNGDIFIDAVDDIPLGHLNAGAGTVTVNAVGGTGQITDGNGATTNITAATATLAADDVIGALGDGIFGGSNSGNNDALETAVTTFASVIASAAGAQINILDSASPIFTVALDAGTAAAGSTLISVTGNLNAGSDVDFADAGDSVGFIATGNVTTTATITVGQDLLLSGADLTDGAGDIDNVIATRAQIVSAADETFAASTIGTLDVTTSGAANAIFDADTSATILADLDGDGSSVNVAGAFQLDTAAQLTVTDGVTAGASVLLDAGNTVMDVDADITAGTSVTLTQSSDLQLAGGVTIDAQAGAADLATAVTGISLDGTGTITVQSGGADNTVNVVGITGSGGTQNLTISSAGNTTLGAAIDLQGGDLSVSVDNNDDGTATLAANGALTNIGDLLLEGGGTGTNDIVDINLDVTVAGGVTVQNASDVQLTGGQTITAQGGDLDIDNNIAQVSLNTAGTVLLQTTVGDNDVNVDSVVGTNPDLTISSTNGVALGSVDLGGANLSVTVDSNNDMGTAVTLAVNEAVTNVNNVTLQGSGAGVDEIIDINQSITAAGALSVMNAAEVQIFGGATLEAQGGALDIATNVTAVTLDGTMGTVQLNTTSDNDVSLAALTSAGDNLTISSQGTAIVSTIDMGTGDLSIDVDADNDGALTLLIDDAITNMLALSV